MGRISLLVVLILVNAFFAAAEIAFISLNDAKIDFLVKEGNKKAKKIKKMLENPSKFLSTIQIGITLAGFLSSAFASETFASNLAPKLYEIFPAIGLTAWNNISIIIITIILSYFTLIFGELVPKRLAMKYYEKIAFGSIGVISFISIVAAPFVRFLTFSTNIVSKIFGISENEEETVTEEEIRMMVDVGEEKGTIDKEESEMINNVFEFDDKVVSEIMIPRNDIYALDEDMTISGVLEKITTDKDFRYSRIPVYKENIDEIRGIVYIKDILMESKDKRIKIKNLKKKAYFIPETKPINELFEELRKNRKQIAIVVDEYGGTAGLVTMEDILEEIVGEIYDEYDSVEVPYKQIDENTFIFNGGVSIDEVQKVLDIKIPEGEYDTISGYLINELGRIPEEHENVEVDTKDVLYTIEKVKERRILKVKAVKKEIEIEEEEDND